VAAEYEPAVRGEEPSLCHLAMRSGAPFAYLQCYRNADYPEWAEIVEASDGISVDFYVGDPNCVGKGLGRAALSEYAARH
jgi:aminoglycoside 6'-N-acetyltransferase